MKFLFLFSLLTSMCTAAFAHAQEPLRIGVIASMYAVVENAKPRLSQQIKVPVSLTAVPNEDIYAALQHKKLPFDVVIFGENERLGSPEVNQFIQEQSQVITSSQVVLWCPDVYLPKRVSLSDAISEANVQSIATPGISSVIGDAFLKAMPELSSKVHLVPTSNSVTALQMAHNGQTQCAVTIDTWLKPTDQFSVISPQMVNFRGLVNQNSNYAAQSKMIISIMGSPLLLQPLMVRSSLITPPSVPSKSTLNKRKKAAT